MSASQPEQTHDAHEVPLEDDQQPNFGMQPEAARAFDSSESLELRQLAAAGLGDVAVRHTISIPGLVRSARELWQSLRERYMEWDHDRRLTPEERGQESQRRKEVMHHEWQRNRQGDVEKAALEALLKRFTAPVHDRGLAAAQAEDAAGEHSEATEARDTKQPDDGQREAQAAQVVRYYHQQLAGLSDEERKALGSNGAQIQDLVFKAALVKGGVDLGQLSVPATMTEWEITRLILRQGEPFEDRWGIRRPGTIDTMDELRGVVSDAAYDVALREAGTTRAAVNRAASRISWPRNRELVHRVSTYARATYDSFMGSPDLQQHMDDYGQYIDELQGRIVFAASNGVVWESAQTRYVLGSYGLEAHTVFAPKKRAVLAPDKVAEAQRVLDLSDAEMAEVIGYTLLPNRAADAGDAEPSGLSPSQFVLRGVLKANKAIRAGKTQA